MYERYKNHLYSLLGAGLIAVASTFFAPEYNVGAQMDTGLPDTGSTELYLPIVSGSADKNDATAANERSYSHVAYLPYVEARQQLVYEYYVSSLTQLQEVIEEANQLPPGKTIQIYVDFDQQVYITCHNEVIRSRRAFPYDNGAPMTACFVIEGAHNWTITFPDSTDSFKMITPTENSETGTGDIVFYVKQGVPEVNFTGLTVFRLSRDGMEDPMGPGQSPASRAFIQNEGPGKIVLRDSLMLSEEFPVNNYPPGTPMNDVTVGISGIAAPLGTVVVDNSIVQTTFDGIVAKEIEVTDSRFMKPDIASGTTSGNAFALNNPGPGNKMNVTGGTIVEGFSKIATAWHDGACYNHEVQMNFSNTRIVTPGPGGAYVIATYWSNYCNPQYNVRMEASTVGPATPTGRGFNIIWSGDTTDGNNNELSMNAVSSVVDASWNWYIDRPREDLPQILPFLPTAGSVHNSTLTLQVDPRNQNSMTHLWGSYATHVLNSPDTCQMFISKGSLNACIYNLAPQVTAEVSSQNK